jgi:hypothetical protein
MDGRPVRECRPERRRLAARVRSGVIQCHGSLPVENAGRVPLRLFVEPYGEDFWLEPGEAVTVPPLVA